MIGRLAFALGVLLVCAAGAHEFDDWDWYEEMGLVWPSVEYVKNCQPLADGGSYGGMQAADVWIKQVSI